MRDIYMYVNKQPLRWYVGMHLIYVTCNLVRWKCNLLYVMRHIYVHMGNKLLTCNLMMSTCNLARLKCEIIMITCNLFMSTCTLIVLFTVSYHKRLLYKTKRAAIDIIWATSSQQFLINCCTLMKVLKKNKLLLRIIE